MQGPSDELFSKDSLPQNRSQADSGSQGILPPGLKITTPLSPFIAPSGKLARAHSDPLIRAFFPRPLPDKSDLSAPLHLARAARFPHDRLKNVAVNSHRTRFLCAIRTRQ